MTTSDDLNMPEGDFDLPDDIAEMLADADTWHELPGSFTDDIVGAVMAEVGLQSPSAESEDQSMSAPSQMSEATEPATNVVSLAERRSLRSARIRSGLVGAAAAALIVLGGIGIAGSLGDDSPSGVEVALAATDVAPDAAAKAEFVTTPQGTRIILNVDELPPAAPGTYYEAWLRTGPEVGVSAGTFHVRENTGKPIELWAGVTTDDYPLFTITLQQEAQTESSGIVVLKVRLDEQ